MTKINSDSDMDGVYCLRPELMFSQAAVGDLPFNLAVEDVKLTGSLAEPLDLFISDGEPDRSELIFELLEEIIPQDESNMDSCRYSIPLDGSPRTTPAEVQPKVPCSGTTDRHKETPVKKNSGIDSAPQPPSADCVLSCKRCGRTCSNKETLRKHIGTHAEPTKKCIFDGCSYVARQRNNLTRHVKTIHDKNEGDYETCDFPGCNYKNLRTDKLLSHMRLHVRGRVKDYSVLYCKRNIYSKMEKACKFLCFTREMLSIHISKKHIHQIPTADRTE